MSLKNWDKYEVALLIEAYQNIKQGRVDKNTALVSLSHNLRKRAQNEGLEIDDTFRNMNGMQWQFLNIERAFAGESPELSRVSQLFGEMVELYSENSKEFQKILEEAHRKITKKIELSDDERKELFIIWLTKNTNISPKAIVDNLNYVSSYAKKRNIIQSSFWGFFDYREFNIIRVKLSGNKLFKIMHGKEHHQFEKNGKLYSDFLKASFSDNTTFYQNSFPQKQVSNYSIEEANEPQNDVTTQSTIIPSQFLKSEACEAINNTVHVENTGAQVGPAFEVSGNSFLNWLIYDLKLSENTGRSYFSAIKTLGKWAYDKGIIEKTLFEINDYNTFSSVETILKSNAEFIQLNVSQHNRFSAAMVKYGQFLYSGVSTIEECNNSDVDYTPYRNILIKFFKRGFRLSSKIDINRFKQYYEEVFDCQLDATDDQIVKNVEQVGFFYDGKIFIPEALVTQDSESNLRDFIDSRMSHSSNVLYYSVIYKEFSNEIGQALFNIDIFREYLKYVCGNKYYFRKDYLAIDAAITPDVREEVVQCLKDIGAPTMTDDIYVRLSHISESRINQVLNGSSDIICNDSNCYFYIEVFPVTEKELASIREYLNSEIALSGYASGKDMLKGMIAKCSGTYERLRQEYTDKGIRKAISYLLREYFEIDNNIISEKGKPMSCSDVFAEFCRSRDRFTIDELNRLKEELGFGTVIYFEPVYENSLRINQNEFISKNLADFDIAKVDEAIGLFCVGDYIAIKEVTNFMAFPQTNFSWNCYLLEHYVSKYSAEYKLVSCGHTAYNCVGAIVKKLSNLDTFDDVITDVLRRAKIDTAEEALEYLVQCGFLARRKYTRINAVLKNARRAD